MWFSITDNSLNFKSTLGSSKRSVCCLEEWFEHTVSSSRVSNCWTGFQEIKSFLLVKGVQVKGVQPSTDQQVVLWSCTQTYTRFRLTAFSHVSRTSPGPCCSGRIWAHQALNIQPEHFLPWIQIWLLVSLNIWRNRRLPEILVSSYF